MTKQLETIKRLTLIKKLLKQGKTTNDIMKNRTVKSWNIQRRQINRYVKDIKDNELYQVTLLKDKDLKKATYRMPKELNEKLKKYCTDNKLVQKEVVILAITEYLNNKS